MTDISVRSTDRDNENQRWIGNGGMPIGQPRSIVLDRSAFDLAADFPDGYIPSGVAIAEITATGLYGPYDNTLANGQETMAGHLFVTVAYDDDSTGDISAALFWSGEVIEAELPTNHGLDANGKTDVSNHIAYV
jgi:hypothetical protein